MNHTTWHRINSGMGIFLPFGMLFLFITGCGLSQKEMMAKDQMERARKTYAEAKANPNVGTVMRRSSSRMPAWPFRRRSRRRKRTTFSSLGYLAEKKTQFAVTIADGKVAERDIDKLNVENAEMIAKKRTLEAERARREMGKARDEAEIARMKAGKAMSEAEQARMAAAADAEKAAIAKREAEQARMAAAADAEKAAIAKRQAEQAESVAEEEAAKAARAKAEADVLMRELSELKAQQTERGIVLTIGDVLFATGKADLSSDANRSVATLAEFLKNIRNGTC